MNDRLWVVFCKKKGNKKWTIQEACSTFAYALNMTIEETKLAGGQEKFKMVQYMPVPEQVAPLLRKAKVKAKARKR